MYMYMSGKLHNVVLTEVNPSILIGSVKVRIFPYGQFPYKWLILCCVLLLWKDSKCH